MYEIIYSYDDVLNVRETFHGSWSELQEHIKQMRLDGCYNITANSLEV
ncbi:MAG: hypothetical protein IJA35_04940 [Clostridia bacterium]|nr:hypothetical protein [Clostridia bacterium]